jgi:hypothetical protein
MGARARDAYLSDHLAGSTAGRNLARRIRSQAEGTPLGERMRSIGEEIEGDRATLEELMRQLGAEARPLKQAGGWLAEKAAGVRFSGITARDRQLGTFLALEALSLGIEGKRCLWEPFAAVAGDQPGLSRFDFTELARRAQERRDAVERERLAWARTALGR